MIRKLLISMFLMVFCCAPQLASAQMDPKVKAISTMSAYGAVGGALLGVASLAFQPNLRSIPIGASLGLYAGILFGSYVVVTHEMKKTQYSNPEDDENYYPDTPVGPYQDATSPSSTYKWNGTPKSDPLIYMNLVSFQF